MPCGSPQTVMARVFNYGLEVYEFKVQLHYYIPFQVNKLGKGRNLLINNSYVLKRNTAVLLQGWL